MRGCRAESVLSCAAPESLRAMRAFWHQAERQRRRPLRIRHRSEAYRRYSRRRAAQAALMFLSEAKVHVRGSAVTMFRRRQAQSDTAEALANCPSIWAERDSRSVRPSAPSHRSRQRAIWSAGAGPSGRRRGRSSLRQPSRIEIADWVGGGEASRHVAGGDTRRHADSEQRPLRRASLSCRRSPAKSTPDDSCQRECTSNRAD